MTREELLGLLQAEGQTLGASMVAQEWEAMIGPYEAAFAHMPLACLTQAFEAWRRGEGEKNPLWATIFPRPDQLARLAEPFWLEERAKQYRERREREGPRQFTAEERATERQKMIDAGYLNADGTPNLARSAKHIPAPDHPRRSPAEVAQELRDHAQARFGGAPISRRHTEPEGDGEVL